MNPNKQFWLLFIPYLVVVVLLTSIIGGCEKKDDGDLNKNYDGTKVTVEVDKTYNVKVTLKYVGSMTAVKYYCDRLQTPAMNEWIELLDCKHFGGTLYIPLFNVKWFTVDKNYNGTGE